LANVADSLAAVREMVFDRQEMTGVALLRALERDFAGDEVLLQRLRACPRFGNDLSDVDVLASEIAQHVFDAFWGQSPWRGGCFLPSCIMFTTYAAEGEQIGAMPDGRRAGEPLADSIGPVTGRDRHGPTAMLRSVTRLPLSSALGTPVLNIRFAKALFESVDGRKAIRDLITTYFGLGGLQIQLSVVDRAVLADALVHPEQHEDLIVRVGGFSAYFNGLTPALKQAILERTEYAL
jgi:formate C-acetyltransferase